MVSPYAWLVTYDELEIILEGIPVLFAAMPTFLPGLWLGSLASVERQDGPWVAYLLTATEILIGLWIIRLGPKRTLAYLLFVLQLSLISSLVFHALILA